MSIQNALIAVLLLMAVSYGWARISTSKTASVEELDNKIKEFWSMLMMFSCIFLPFGIGFLLAFELLGSIAGFFNYHQIADFFEGNFRRLTLWIYFLYIFCVVLLMFYTSINNRQTDSYNAADK